MSLIKHVIKLHQKKHRKDSGQFLVEGIKGVKDAILAGAEVDAVVVEGGRREEPLIKEIISLAEKKQIPIEYCARKDIADIKSTDVFPGVLAVVAMSEADLEDFDLTQPIICLDRVNDPGNLGTIIRTADWFGIKNILLSEESVDPYNEKVVRSTMGSLFHTTIVEHPNLLHGLRQLKADGYHLIRLDMGGKDIKDLKFEPKSVYIFGSESHGVREEIQELCESTVAIPGVGEAESLNVGVAAAIVMYQCST